MTATLTKTQRVLDRRVDPGFGPPRMKFTRLPDEPGDLPTSVWLDTESWEDMGEPETITVTVEPGDLLNQTEGN